MIVLHAIWDHLVTHQLHIWGETTQSQPAAKRMARSAFHLPLHPFVARLSQEASPDLEHLFPHFESQPSESLVLRLPASSRAPLSSPEMRLGDDYLPQPFQSFQSWKLISYRIPVDETLETLLDLPVESSGEIAFGQDLRYWMEAARYGLELLAQQLYLPIVTEHPRAYFKFHAGWQAIPQKERLRALAGLMPPVCWSYLQANELNGQVPETILQDFLDSSLDGFIRKASRNVTLPTLKSKRKELPIVEQWFTALIHDPVHFAGSEQALRDFARDLHGWQHSLDLTEQHAPFRTCFRLEPPEQPKQEEEQDASLEKASPDWHLRFFLQALDDRSLLVPAHEVWRERSHTLNFLNHAFENPQERLLSDLGKAARIYPQLTESLRGSRPEILTLSSEDAYCFLRETAPLLEQSGFGIQVPPWWQKVRPKLRLQLRAPQASVGTSVMGMNTLVDYDWSVSVGEQQIEAEEFERLVELKQPLVKVRGQWVEIRPEEAEAAIAFFKKRGGHGKLPLKEALQMSLGEPPEAQLPIEEVTTSGWIEEIFSKLQQKNILESIPQPDSFQGRLRPYQLKGFSWLHFLKRYGFGACLADDMGLGKTAQLIALLLQDQEAGGATGPVLLVCPMSIVGNWQRELERFAPSLSILVHHGADRLTPTELKGQVQEYALVVTTYALLARDQEALAEIEWHGIVLDEAQNIKNSSTRQAQAARALQGQYKIALTGTPVENRLSELWSILEFLNPGYLGSQKSFQQQFVVPIERNHDKKRSEQLKNLVQPFILRRLKTDKTIIQDLPEKMEMPVYCNLTAEQASLYQAVVKEMLEKIQSAEGIERKGLVLSTIARLKQVCNHPAQFMGDNSVLSGRSGKLNRLEEMLEEVLEEGDKTLIFTQFAEMGKLLRPYLVERFGREVLFLHGETPRVQRDAMVQRFQQEADAAPIFLLSLKAGGVGLNLTAASHVFHFDRWWNPAVENQATDRAFRIGQRRNVQVHKFVCTGTLEERIEQMITQKQELAATIIGAGEGWLTELSTEQLKDLFTLSRDAVGA